MRNWPVIWSHLQRIFSNILPPLAVTLHLHCTIVLLTHSERRHQTLCRPWMTPSRSHRRGALCLDFCSCGLGERHISLVISQATMLLQRHQPRQGHDFRFYLTTPSAAAAQNRKHRRRIPPTISLAALPMMNGQYGICSLPVFDSWFSQYIIDLLEDCYLRRCCCLLRWKLV